MVYIRARKHALPLRRSNVSVLAAFAALTIPAAAVHAQQTEVPATGSPVLPEIKAKAASENVAKPEQVASPKYTAPLLDTPQTITVLPSKVLEQQNRVSLVEALSTVPGITFGAGEGGGGYGDSINFRGYSANNNITVDGMRDSAQYNRSDAFNLEQIEVTNGANSVYGGAGNVSGGINLVSKSPKAENFGRVSLGLGTDSYRRATADVNRLLGETTAFRVNVMAHGNDVPGRDVEEYKRWGIAPSITFGLNTPTQLTLSYLHQRDENVPQYGVPYYRNAFNNGLIPGAKSSNYYGYRDVDTQEIDVDMFTVVFDHRFSDRFRVRNQTRAQRIDQFLVVNPPQGSYCLASGTLASDGTPCATPGLYTPSGPRGSTRDSSNDYLANQTDFTTEFKTGGIEHTLVTGFSLSHERYRLVNGNSLRNPGGALPNPVLPPMDIANPEGVYGGPVNFVATGRTRGELDNVAVYLFDNLKFNEQWALNGGVRYEKNRTSSSTDAIAAGVTTSSPTQSRTDNLTSFRVGLVYKPVPIGSFYVAYGNSKTPSKATVNGACTQNETTTTGNNNCNVAPETAINIEVGTKWDVLDNRLSLTAAVFRNELRNYRVNSNDPTVPDQQLDGKSRVDGVALGAAGQITPQWSVSANYTYLDSEVLSGASDFCVANPTALNCDAALAMTGNPLTNTPEHAFSLWTTYQFVPSLTVGYGVLYQGSWYLNNALPPLYKAPSYWVQNAMVAYQVNRSLDLQLNVKNLTDRTYYTRIRNNGWATPGDGRAVTLTASYAF
ncbi:TonB-dependent siderophore receptor [Methylibium sp. Pch-M]|uniref:TonB-dependent receptor n=1 Tax=Methylibium sp. Pch-M TaxID=2082386 RepID=UPI001010D195|nr:TonB-dependent siderophore receptor [Methylibium sp. Pch-M]QAZ39467.1 TonB-dependent siderophore receptor [Methylibium sp. Pch-M]